MRGGCEEIENRVMRWEEGVRRWRTESDEMGGGCEEIQNRE